MEGKMMQYEKNPYAIEEESFKIIQKIIEEEMGGFDFKNEFEKAIYKRCIHTSADFDYLKNLKISEDFQSSIVSAFQNKATLYTDTNMALSGINKTALGKMGMQVRCYVSEEETVRIAKEKGITRSMASVLRMLEEEGDKVLVVGNAPTFLYQAMEEIQRGDRSVKAIIGVPVGFVGAAESKELLSKQDIPHVAALGRKGGSNIAAAIVNAILYSLTGRD